VGTSEVVLWVFGQLVVAAAIWGGIRADIKAIHGRIEQAEESALNAHLRIDRILDNCRYGRENKQ